MSNYRCDRKLKIYDKVGIGFYDSNLKKANKLYTQLESEKNNLMKYSINRQSKKKLNKMLDDYLISFEKLNKKNNLNKFLKPSQNLLKQEAFDLKKKKLHNLFDNRENFFIDDGFNLSEQIIEKINEENQDNFSLLRNKQTQFDYDSRLNPNGDNNINEEEDNNYPKQDDNYTKEDAKNEAKIKENDNFNEEVYDDFENNNNNNNAQSNVKDNTQDIIQENVQENIDNIQENIHQDEIEENIQDNNQNNIPQDNIQDNNEDEIYDDFEEKEKENELLLFEDIISKDIEDYDKLPAVNVIYEKYNIPKIKENIGPSSQQLLQDKLKEKADTYLPPSNQNNNELAELGDEDYEGFDDNDGFKIENNFDDIK